MLYSNLVLLATATSVLASPVQSDTTITLPLKRLNQVNSVEELFKQGKARISRAKDIANAPLENAAVSYLVNVTVGAGNYQLILDTGSSITWVGAGKAYKPGPDSKNTGHEVSQYYGTGNFDGTEYIDTVSVGSATVKAQGVGVANSSSDFRHVDSILGVGPIDLTQGAVDGVKTVPTFMNNLAKDKVISKEILGVYFKPEKGGDDNDVNGELTIGGADDAKYTGKLQYTSLQTSGAAAPFWGISASFKYNNTKLGSTKAGIVDTGTTLIYFPTHSYQAFLKATNGTDDSGSATFDKKPTASLTITIGSNDYKLTPDQYLIPTDQLANFKIKDKSKHYSWIADGGDGTSIYGPSPDAIIGQKFLEQYYSVFDTDNSRVGFAKAA